MTGPFLTAVDLFAGPGGWDVAARELAVAVVGVENDADTCITRRLAGLHTHERDVRSVRRGHLVYPADLLIASPPCQTFSMAGKGAGRRALDDVLAWADKIDAGEALDPYAFDDERTGLILEPLRWLVGASDSARPYRYVALEQVPHALPVWDYFAEILRRRGYGVATGVLSAEQFGVPQTRRRAFLVAELDAHRVELPVPTHRAYRKGVRQHEGDPALLPWVSMADAIEWGMTQRPYPTIASSRTTGGPDKEKVGGSRARAEIYAERDEGRWVMAGAGTSCQTTDPRPIDAPAQTLTGKATAEWGRRPTRALRPNDRDPYAVRLTLDETAILQGFPADYPWHGTARATFRQVGNAVPPPLARAVLRALVYGE